MPAILPLLFGDSVVTEEIDLFAAELSELLPEEAADISRAGSARLQEFRAGRHCARAALHRLGIAGTPICRGTDRSPIWPSGFVGSISHTRRRDRGFCGAVVARAADVLALGLDVELDEPLERKLWDRILTPSELTWLDSLPEENRGYFGKVVFSAKECAYKCQYPLSRQFLEFADVTVTISEERGETFATLLREAGPFPMGSVFPGRFTRRAGIIATGTTLLAASV